MKKLFFAILLIAVVAINIYTPVQADGECKPPSVENCPRPAGHEDDPIAPPDGPGTSPVVVDEMENKPALDKATRPPGHENEVDAPSLDVPPEKVFYPFMDFWK